MSETKNTQENESDLSTNDFSKLSLEEINQYFLILQIMQNNRINPLDPQRVDEFVWALKDQFDEKIIRQVARFVQTEALKESARQLFSSPKALEMFQARYPESYTRLKQMILEDSSHVSSVDLSRKLTTPGNVPFNDAKEVLNHWLISRYEDVKLSEILSQEEQSSAKEDKPAIAVDERVLPKS